MRCVVLVLCCACLRATATAPSSVPGENIATLLPASTGASSNDRVVFMHIQATGGTTVLEWMLRLHAVCAQNFTVEQSAEMDGGYRFLNADPLPEANLDACGPARKVCQMSSMSGPNGQAQQAASMVSYSQTASGSSCLDDAKRLVDDGCTFVELHHFDVSVVDAFRSHGFKAMTVLRNPIDRRASELRKWETGATGNHLAQKIEIWSHHAPDHAIRFLAACWADEFRGSCVRDMEKSSEEGLAMLGRELRGKLEATQPAAYCSQGITPTVTRDVQQRLFEIASETMHTSFDVVGTTEHMQNLCKNVLARFNIRVPLLPSDEYHSHKVHSPHCAENGGDANCTEAPLLDLEEDAAKDELGLDVKLWREAFTMQVQQNDALDSGAYMQALVKKHAIEQRQWQREAGSGSQDLAFAREPRADDGLSGRPLSGSG